ncbi:MAG: hypothetical protein KDC67_04370 [Ignavibacteriae bacterium]|nr:hypothetical protein [Ignavibacteriota bacterium]
MKIKTLNYNEYLKYFEINRIDCGIGIEQDDEFPEYYLNAQTFLPKSYFDINPNIHDSIYFWSFNENQIPDEVLVKFELFGIGNIGENKAFIFKPWIVNIDNPYNCEYMEQFHLFMPDYIFYLIIDKAIFMEQFNWDQLSQLRVIKDIDKNEFKKFGLTTDTVETLPFTMKSHDLIIELDKSLQSKIKNDEAEHTIKEKYYTKFQKYF